MDGNIARRVRHRNLLKIHEKMLRGVAISAMPRAKAPKIQ
jgi:hypothetical protein